MSNYKRASRRRSANSSTRSNPRVARPLSHPLLRTQLPLHPLPLNHHLHLILPSTPIPPALHQTLTRAHPSQCNSPTPLPVGPPRHRLTAPHHLSRPPHPRVSRCPRAVPPTTPLPLTSLPLPPLPKANNPPRNPRRVPTNQQN